MEADDLIVLIGNADATAEATYESNSSVDAIARGAIDAGLVRSVRNCDKSVARAVCECANTGDKGAFIVFDGDLTAEPADAGKAPLRILASVSMENESELLDRLRGAGVPCSAIGRVMNDWQVNFDNVASVDLNWLKSDFNAAVASI